MRINTTQDFSPVPPEVWEYAMGRYRVCEKWLRERAERQLTLGEIPTYCHIVAARVRTISLAEEIDEVYSRVGRALLLGAGLQRPGAQALPPALTRLGGAADHAANRPTPACPGSG